MKELVNLLNLNKILKNAKTKKKNISDDNIDKKTKNPNKDETESLLERLELEKAIFIRNTRRSIEKTYCKKKIDSS